MKKLLTILLILVLFFIFPVGTANAGGQVCGKDGFQDDHVGIWLYTQPNFKGTPAYLCSSSSKLYNALGNNVSSYKVVKKDYGYYIKLYGQKDYNGNSIEASGEVANLGSWNNRISSIKMGSLTL